MIHPVNNHIVIEPVPHETFMFSDRQTYDEIGIVKGLGDEQVPFKLGDRVFFDSWLASKYPKNETEYYWLVNINDVRAYEKQVSEE